MTRGAVTDSFSRFSHRAIRFVDTLAPSRIAFHRAKMFAIISRDAFAFAVEIADCIQLERARRLNMDIARVRMYTCRRLVLNKLRFFENYTLIK